jgi:hypothetical protein
MEQYQKAMKLKPDMKGLKEKIEGLEARKGIRK